MDSSDARFTCVSTPQYPGQPNQGQPYPGQQNPYAYNPYGSSYAVAPALQPIAQPVRRPGLMILSLVLMILASLPFLFFGAALLLVKNASDVPAQLLDSPRLQQAGATPELLISAMRLVGGIVLVVVAAYLFFGVMAFAGRNWARIVTAVLTVGFVLLLAAGLVSSIGAVDMVSLFAVLLVMSVGAVAILFSPGANAWYAYRR
jgi:hypothetical protein